MGTSISNLDSQDLEKFLISCFTTMRHSLGKIYYNFVEKIQFKISSSVSKPKPTAES